MQVTDPHKSTVEVRGADRRQGSKVVLIVSTLAVIVALALIYWWFSVYNPGTSINNHY